MVPVQRFREVCLQVHKDGRCWPQVGTLVPESQRDTFWLPGHELGWIVGKNKRVSKPKVLREPHGGYLELPELSCWDVQGSR